MDQAAVKLATMLLSRAWSGGSMVAGVANAVGQVKQELPEADSDLLSMIKELEGQLGDLPATIKAEPATTPSSLETLPATTEELQSAGRLAVSKDTPSTPSPARQRFGNKKESPLREDPYSAAVEISDDESMPSMSALKERLSSASVSRHPRPKSPGSKAEIFSSPPPTQKNPSPKKTPPFARISGKCDEREKMLEMLQQQAKIIEELRAKKKESPCKTPRCKSQRSPKATTPKHGSTTTASQSSKDTSASSAKKRSKSPSPLPSSPPKKPKTEASLPKDQNISQEQSDDHDEKFWNRMRSKVNRMCCMTPGGKLQVSPDIHEMWKQAGMVRDNLVSLMAEANGDRAVFVRKVEQYKETQRYRKMKTEGGFYTETEMRKPVSEGGLGFTAKRVSGIIAWCEQNPGHTRENKYDGDTEYWVDIRTKGVRGSKETEGLKDSTSTQGEASGMGDTYQPGKLDEGFDLRGHSSASVESGTDKVKETIQRYMNEAVTSRDKLSKFMERLDRSDTCVKAEWPKMEEVCDLLGKYYDELASMQADARIKEFSEEQQKLFTKKCEDVKRQMILATSMEVKNKKLKKKTAQKSNKKREPEEEQDETPKNKRGRKKGPKAKAGDA
ncbi:unnamed protein product [Symbiodinium sp. CCMP2592]|nr:unnamed protein product [Symbiodinium sp. CCMP2592]